MHKKTMKTIFKRFAPCKTFAIVKLNMDGYVVGNIWEVGQPSVAVRGKHIFGKLVFGNHDFF